MARESLSHMAVTVLPSSRPHRDFLEAARAEKSDITLQALCDRMSAERNKADTSMMSRFFLQDRGDGLKKDPRRA